MPDPLVTLVKGVAAAPAENTLLQILAELRLLREKTEEFNTPGHSFRFRTLGYFQSGANLVAAPTADATLIADLNLDRVALFLHNVAAGSLAVIRTESQTINGIADGFVLQPNIPVILQPAPLERVYCANIGGGSQVNVAELYVTRGFVRSTGRR